MSLRRNRLGPGRTRTAAGGRTVSATEAARSFSDLLNRVRYRGERVTIERAGVPVCEMSLAVPRAFKLSELAELLDTAAQPDHAYWDIVEEVTRTQPTLQPGPWES